MNTSTTKIELTLNQKLIRNLIIKHRNDYVGWNENSYSDNGHTWSKNPSVKGCEDYIYNQIMNSKEKYQETEGGYMIETKHIRFEGAEWVRNLIQKSVAYSLRSGWNFPYTTE